MANLTASTTLALGKAIKDAALKTAAADMEAGVYAVDVNVRILGNLTVGESYEQKMVQKAKPWQLLTVALNEMNKQREAAGMTGLDMTKLIEMAETVDPKLVDKAEADAAEAIEKVKGSTTSKCNGKITTKLEVEVIDQKVSKI